MRAIRCWGLQASCGDGIRAHQARASILRASRHLRYGRISGSCRSIPKRLGTSRHRLQRWLRNVGHRRGRLGYRGGHWCWGSAHLRHAWIACSCGSITKAIGALLLIIGCQATIGVVVAPCLRLHWGVRGVHQIAQALDAHLAHRICRQHELTIRKLGRNGVGCAGARAANLSAVLVLAMSGLNTHKPARGMGLGMCHGKTFQECSKQSPRARGKVETPEGGACKLTSSALRRFYARKQPTQPQLAKPQSRQSIWRWTRKQPTRQTVALATKHYARLVAGDRAACAAHWRLAARRRPA